MPFLYYIEFDLDFDQKEGCYVGAMGRATSLSDMYKQTDEWERTVTKRCHVASMTRWSWQVKTFAKADRFEMFMAGADMFDEDSYNPYACRWFTINNVPEVSALKKFMEPAKCVESVCDFTNCHIELPCDADAAEELTDDGGDEAFEKGHADDEKSFY